MLGVVIAQFVWLLFVGAVGWLGLAGAGVLSAVWPLGALLVLFFSAWRCAGFQVGLGVVAHLAHRALLYGLLLIPASIGVVLGLCSLISHLSVDLWRMFWGRWFMGRARISRLRTRPRLRALWRLGLRRSVERTTALMERAVDPMLHATRHWSHRRGRGGHLAICGVSVESEGAVGFAEELRSRWQVAAAAGPALCSRPYAHVLPQNVVPRTPAEAETLRVLLGVDLVAWGHVHADGSLWIHVQRPPHEHHGDCDLFPSHWSLDLPPILRLDAHDGEQLDLLVRLLEIQVLADREQRRPWLLPKAADRAGTALSRERETWTRALFEHLLRLPDDVLPDALSSSVHQVLSRSLSDWVGFELSDAHSSINDERLQRRLVDSIEKCLTLEPDRPEHYYRYATLLCLMDEEENARRALEAAATRAEDFPVRVADSDLARVESALRHARPHDERRLVLARGAVQAARAVHVAGEEVAEPLRVALERHRWWADMDEFQPHAGLSMLRSLTGQS